jgi:glycerol 3-phosphatase-1
VGSFSWHLSAHITLWFVASHGIRTAENLRKFCGIEDPDELEVEIIHLLSIQTVDVAHSARPKNLSWKSSRVLLVAGASLNFRASVPSSKTCVALSFAQPAERGCLCSHLPQLASGSTLPNPKWAVCTSATRKYATSALSAAGIIIPDVFVTSEDVKQGKPA